jgi:hypothetical protein
MFITNTEAVRELNISLEELRRIKKLVGIAGLKRFRLQWLRNFLNEHRSYK